MKARGWWGAEQVWKFRPVPATALMTHRTWPGDEWTARLPEGKVFIVLAKRWKPAQSLNEFSKVDGVTLNPR